jgi:Fic family protein
MLFETPRLDQKEEEVLARINEARARLKYALGTARRWTGLLARATLARSIRGSNSIEGYNVSVEDAIAAVDGGEPLNAENEIWMAVVGYRRAMTYILQLADDPHFTFHEGFLRSLHYMMLSHDLVRNPGKWRPGNVYVRQEETGDILYEGPDADAVPELMAELVQWLGQKDDSPAMVKAAMSHLNLIMIHPFSDGNGRMSRALQTLVLVREGVLDKEFCSIEEYLGGARQEYYDVLQEVGGLKWDPKRAARKFVRFCLTAHYRQAETLLRRTKIIGSVWADVEAEVKRLGLPERMELALAEAAMGFTIRNSTYRSIAEISENLASRDLKTLVNQNLLVAEGERRGRVYKASDQIAALRHRAVEGVPDRSREDPFALEQGQMVTDGDRPGGS